MKHAFYSLCSLLGCGTMPNVQETELNLIERVGDCTAVTPDVWPDGTDCEAALPILTQQVDADTFILRQSLCTHFEAPFMYLMFGTERVLLEDTGTGDVDVQAEVAGIIAQWLTVHERESIELIVINSHEHGDHTGGNAQFRGRPSTTLIEPGVTSLRAHFDLAAWPTQTAQIDLGGRVIDVVPIPGHSSGSIALFDSHTKWLLTGDSLYPGRLYVRDFSAYRASMNRLAARYERETVCQVMGTHIEMTTTAGLDYGDAAETHPDEHLLRLGHAQLKELSDALTAMPKAIREVHDDFIIYPLGL